MTKADAKVLQFKKQQEEFSSFTTDLEEIFPGFSSRLNELVDKTDLEVPPLDDGRQAYLSELFSASKMAAGDWLKKDKPPKPTMLRKVVAYMLAHTEWATTNPLKVEAWLKYGSAIQNPFERAAIENEALYPLASTVISQVARESGVPGSQIDLVECLKQTVELFASFDINRLDKVELVHKKIVEQIVRQNRTDK